MPRKKKQPDDLAILTKLTDAVNKARGHEALTENDYRSRVDLWVPTASHLVNLFFGRPHRDPTHIGVPAGKVIEIFGDEAKGKTTMLQIIFTAFQQMGFSVLLDEESKWDALRASDYGHNPDRHRLIPADVCEEGFSTIEQIVDNYEGGKKPIVVGWDTIAASSHYAERTGESDSLLTKPKLIRRELRKIVPRLIPSNVTLIFVNQTIEGPDRYKSAVKKTPTGGGIKFHSVQRVQVGTRGYYYRTTTESKDKLQSPLGVKAELWMVKNGLGPPLKRVVLPIHFKRGLDPERELMWFLMDHKVVQKRGNRLVLEWDGGEVLFFEKDIPEVVRETEGLYEWMKKKSTECWLL
jgi:RecA/RadA recombinase